MDEVETQRKVAAAILDLIKEETAGGPSFHVMNVADRSGIDDLDLVAAMVGDLNVDVVDDDEICWDDEDRRRLTKVVRLKPKSGSSTANTLINYGSNNQMAAGGDVTGTLNVTITYEEVLNQLVRDIEKSPLPPEEKASLLSKVRGVLKEGGIQVLKVTLAELAKSAYAHSGEIVAVGHELGRLI